MSNYSISTEKRWFLVLLLLGILTGCTSPGVTGASIASAPLDTPVWKLFAAPADATPTPTPFQPLPPTPVYIPTYLPTAAPTIQATQEPAPYLANDPQLPVGALPLPPDQMNILLLGSDARPYSRLFRTDTIILLTLNPSQGTVSLTSFPRDLYLMIPGWGMDRINTAWARGGFSKLAATFEHNFGVRPEHYVLINFSSFKQVIDSLGGLEVNVGQTLSDYKNGRYITIKKGATQMDADMILWYVRSRKTSNDFARNQRQQEVILALFNKLLSLGALRRAPEFYQIYKDNVTTDLRLTDLLPLLPLAATLSDTSRIRNYYVGPQHVYDWITPGGGMVLVPRGDGVRKVIRRALSIE